MTESIKNGWVVTTADGKSFYESTFSRVRSEAIGKWVGLWVKPNNWKGHYRKGHRCVKATQRITLKQ